MPSKDVYLIEHEAHIGLLAQAAAQAAENLQAESFIGSRIIARVNVHLDLHDSFKRTVNTPQTSGLCL